MTEAREPRVLDLASLKALAHPLRVQIIDALSAHGAATASALAERLGESSGATSYHLRQLARHGLVREVEGRGTARERWWERVPQPIRVDASDFEPDAAERLASGLVVAEMQRTRSQRLQEFLLSGPEVLGPEWLKASGIATSNVQLTREQLSALGDDLMAVLDSYLDRYRGQRTPGARPVQIHLDLFPLVDGVEQPADPDSPEAS